MVGMSKAKAENRALPKRFYAAVSVAEISDGFAITLDDKIVKTPAKKNLAVASPLMAEAIAAEWQAQGEFIDTDTMPLTRLANITLDVVPASREALLMDISGYGETDLVCYRAPLAANDSELGADATVLRARQDAAFDPLLRWLTLECGIALDITEGIMPVAQSSADLKRIAAVFAAANDAELAALAMLIPMLGSAVLGIALWKRHLDLETALHIARLDEDFQAEKWGMDVHVAKEWDAKKRDIRAAVFYLNAPA